MFFGKRSSSRKKSHSPFSLIKSVLAMVVLTAFVLALSFFIRELSTTTPTRLIDLSSPVLSRLGVTEDEAGQVAGEFIKRIGETSIKESAKEVSVTVPITPESSSDKVALLRVALMSDSENDTITTKKALNILKEENIKNFFYLGDLTNWGDLNSLTTMKGFFDESGVNYYVLAGDHDLAASVQQGDTLGLNNFKSVFGNNFHSVTISGKKFVLLGNGANHSLIDSETITWFKQELVDADFVILAQPLYHPTNSRVMGYTDGEVDQLVKEQALELLNLIRASDVNIIFSADQHLSSENKDPIKNDLLHVVIGALISNSTQLRNPQTPRFTIFTLYEDDTYKIEDKIL